MTTLGLSRSNLVVCFTIAVVQTSSLEAQVYTHPTVPLGSGNAGSCLTLTCGGTYYDNGGALGNYSDNIGNINRVFCPSVAGNCLTATFTQFDVVPNGPCADNLKVYNGSTATGVPIQQPAGFCGNASLPGPFTGTTNGCLTFSFTSNSTLNSPGWAANLTCAPCANGPTGLTNSDCQNAPLLCGGTTIPGNSSGPGLAAEACGGGNCPNGGEGYSHWYAISIQSSGTFTFTLSPATSTDNYDYALYGPNATCSTLGAPVRCSDAASSGSTGLNASSVDLTEGTGGDRFTAALNVVGGEMYYLLVDEASLSGSGYTLSFGGTATVGCIFTSVELTAFEATYDREARAVLLKWETMSELGSVHFDVERSTDGQHFESIGRVAASGTNQEHHSYSFMDRYPFAGEINYYRLREIDESGSWQLSDTRAVALHDPQAKFGVFPNPAGDRTTVTYSTARLSGVCVLQLFDSSARLLGTSEFMPERGRNEIPLDLSHLPPGVYFLTLHSGEELYRTAFVRE